MNVIDASWVRIVASAGVALSTAPIGSAHAATLLTGVSFIV